MSLLVCGGIFSEQIAGTTRLGGSGLTAALGAAAQGAEVSLAGWVGESEAEEAFELLDGAGVDRLGVLVLEGPSTRYVITQAADLAHPHPQLTQGAVPDGPLPALPDAKVVLCFGTPGFDAIRAGWLDRPASGGTLIFDRQGTHSLIDSSAMAASVPSAGRILLANAQETLAATGSTTFAAAVQDLPPEGFDTTICKCGPWGVLVRDEDGERAFGAHPVMERNTIGSGDVFAGSLAARLSDGAGLADAVPLAVSAAARWVSCPVEASLRDIPTQILGSPLAPAVWVDRRGLERARYVVALGPGLDTLGRDRVDRALRYLGMETTPAAGHRSQRLSVTGIDGAGSAQDAVAAAVNWARAEYGERLDTDLQLAPG